MLKVATVCSGIGSPEQALKELGIEHENVFACEKDKYAKQTYLSNFKPNKMLEDMTTENWDKPELYSDLFIGGIPCQSFSLAGKRLGINDARGLLFYNFYDYVKIQKPKYFIIENVKGLLSDAKGRTFNTWLELLGASVNYQYNMINHEDSLLYNLHWTVLNSKNFGVPQNRERVFLIGIRGDLPNEFRFPLGEPLKLRLKDILETTVAEKYYLSEKMLNYLHTRKDNFNSGKINFKNENDIATCRYASSKSLDISDNIIVEKDRTRIISDESEFTPSILANQAKASTDAVFIKESVCGAFRGRDLEKPSNRKTGADLQQTLEIRNDGLTNTITTVQKDNIILEQVGQLDTTHESDGRIYSEKGLSPTLTCKSDKKPLIETFQTQNRIRRLTPLECFRLQGFPDSYIKPCSDSQTYKQAGNTITVNVIKAILKNLLC